MSDLNSRALGGTALLRMAGLPVRLWLAGGCPELFALLTTVEELAIDYRREAQVLAEKIGADLVPHPALNPLDRRELLKLRRDLHNGQRIPVRHATAIVARISHLGAPGRPTAEDVLATVNCGQRLWAAQARLAEELHAEQRRVQELP